MSFAKSSKQTWGSSLISENEGHFKSKHYMQYIFFNSISQYIKATSVLNKILLLCLLIQLNPICKQIK